jgi:hypothetical protein
MGETVAPGVAVRADPGVGRLGSGNDGTFPDGKATTEDVLSGGGTAREGVGRPSAVGTTGALVGSRDPGGVPGFSARRAFATCLAGAWAGVFEAVADAIPNQPDRRAISYAFTVAAPATMTTATMAARNTTLDGLRSRLGEKSLRSTRANLRASGSDGESAPAMMAAARSSAVVPSGVRSRQRCVSS